MRQLQSTWSVRHTVLDAGDTPHVLVVAGPGTGNKLGVAAQMLAHGVGQRGHER